MPSLVIKGRWNDRRRVRKGFYWPFGHEYGREKREKEMEKRKERTRERKREKKNIAVVWTSPQFL